MMRHPWKAFGWFCVVAIIAAAVVRPSQETITAAALILGLLAVIHLVRHPKLAIGIARKLGATLVQIIRGICRLSAWVAAAVSGLIRRLANRHQTDDDAVPATADTSRT